MRLMAPFCFRQGKQDRALFTVPALCEIPVHGGLGALIRQVLAPAPDIRSARLRFVGGILAGRRFADGVLMAGFGVLRHGGSWA
jgi:hypothetical protein